MKIWGSLFVVALSCGSLLADAPTADFKKFAGQMYGEADQGKPAHRSHQELTIAVPAGMVIDANYSEGSIACCGGDENGNGNSTSVPSGIYIEVGGGNAGEWGILSIKRSSITDDNTGKLTGYKVEAELYCGPSADHGGCNVHLFAWAKLRPIPKR
jgi:hypothetical protein